MQTFTRFILLLLTLVWVMSCKERSSQESPYSYLYQNLPFEMPLLSPPEFPNYSISVTDFGGVGDGIALNTGAFAKAMDHLASRGGGRLIVPAGVWFTGPIVLQSNINLHLEDRSIILFSPDKDLYPLVETSFEGLDTRRCQSPIWGKDLQNIAITGSGAIDGNGHYWRPLKRDKVTERQWEHATSHGGVFKRDDYWMPSAAYLHGDTTSDMNVPRNLQSEEEWLALRDFLRPVMVSLQHCKDVFLQGVIFQNSPAWNIHPLMCENVIIDGIQVRNPSFAQNGDGIDLESCRNSLIVNSTFDVGDDAICIKSGKDEDGRKRNMPTENLIVNNCTVFKGHGGFVVGSEMSGGVKNVSVSNCQFMGTDVGLRFKSRRGRGGVVENIYISDISMFDIATEPLLFNLFYGGKSAVESLEDGDQVPQEERLPPIDETTPAFRNIFVERITCRNARRAMYFHGLPEQNIGNIHIEDFVVHAREGAELIDSEEITLKNIQIFAESGAALKLHNVRNLTVENLITDPVAETIYQVRGSKTEKIILNRGVDQTLIGPEVEKDAVTFVTEPAKAERQ